MKNLSTVTVMIMWVLLIVLLVSSPVRADWSDPLQLTNNTEMDGHPSISSDESKIAFTSREAGWISDEEIWVVNSDGKGLKQLTDNTALDGNPSISGDGSKVAFESDLDGDYEVWIVSLDIDAVTHAVDYTPYLVGGGITAVVIIGVVGYIVFRRKKQ